MPTASKRGTHRATRQNWRPSDRARSRSGPRPHRRLNPFTELASALSVLIRLHQAHPDWAPPVVAPVPLDPVREAAINFAYGLSPTAAATADPSSTT